MSYDLNRLDRSLSKFIKNIENHKDYLKNIERNNQEINELKSKIQPLEYELQCYEGRKKNLLKDNNTLQQILKTEKIAFDNINSESIDKYLEEEKAKELKKIASQKEINFRQERESYKDIEKENILSKISKQKNIMTKLEMEVNNKEILWHDLDYKINNYSKLVSEEVFSKFYDLISSRDMIIQTYHIYGYKNDYMKNMKLDKLYKLSNDLIHDTNLKSDLNLKLEQNYDLGNKVKEFSQVLLKNLKKIAYPLFLKNLKRKEKIVVTVLYYIIILILVFNFWEYLTEIIMILIIAIVGTSAFTVLKEKKIVSNIKKEQEKFEVLSYIVKNSEGFVSEIADYVINNKELFIDEYIELSNHDKYIKEKLELEIIIRNLNDEKNIEQKKLDLINSELKKYNEEINAEFEEELEVIKSVTDKDLDDNFFIDIRNNFENWKRERLNKREEEKNKLSTKIIENNKEKEKIEADIEKINLKIKDEKDGIDRCNQQKEINQSKIFELEKKYKVAYNEIKEPIIYEKIDWESGVFELDPIIVYSKTAFNETVPSELLTLNHNYEPIFLIYDNELAIREKDNAIKKWKELVECILEFTLSRSKEIVNITIVDKRDDLNLKQYSNKYLSIIKELKDFKNNFIVKDASIKIDIVSENKAMFEMKKEKTEEVAQFAEFKISNDEYFKGLQKYDLLIILVEKESIFRDDMLLDILKNGKKLGIIPIIIISDETISKNLKDLLVLGKDSLVKYTYKMEINKKIIDKEFIMKDSNFIHR